MSATVAVLFFGFVSYRMECVSEVAYSKIHRSLKNGDYPFKLEKEKNGKGSTYCYIVALEPGGKRLVQSDNDVKLDTLSEPIAPLITENVALPEDIFRARFSHLLYEIAFYWL